MKREALVLLNVFGPLGGAEDEKWDALVGGGVMQAHGDGVARARILVCWAAASDEICEFFVVVHGAYKDILLKLGLGFWVVQLCRRGR